MVREFCYKITKHSRPDEDDENDEQIFQTVLPRHTHKHSLLQKMHLENNKSSLAPYKNTGGSVRNDKKNKTLTFKPIVRGISNFGLQNMYYKHQVFSRSHFRSKLWNIKV